MKAVVAAVIRRGERFLLCQRPSGKRHEGLWEFPGGKVSEGESDDAAIKRELAEELGVEACAVSASIAEHRDGESEYVVNFLEVRIVNEPECREHAEIGWYSTEEIRRLSLAPADSAFAASYLQV